MPPKVIAVVGPTASGKTRLGVALAKRLGGEVISVDSMQVYRQMDIGTAKPTAQEMDGIPHHMIDVADPWEDYSVSRYVQEAIPLVEQVLSRGKLPILVGGTGLYLDSLLSGRSFAPRAEDPALRQALEAQAQQEGTDPLLRRLAQVDPISAASLHPNDAKRIIRALEVFQTTGVPISEHNARTKLLPPRYDACTIGLAFAQREEQRSRIDRRVDEMMAQGLLAEVEQLLTQGIPGTATAMQAIGYKELQPALAGQCSLADAVGELKLRSRQYAKRQLTWLRRKPAIHWILWASKPDFDLALHHSTQFIKESGLL